MKFTLDFNLFTCLAYEYMQVLCKYDNESKYLKK